MSQRFLILFVLTLAVTLSAQPPKTFVKKDVLARCTAEFGTPERLKSGKEEEWLFSLNEKFLLGLRIQRRGVSVKARVFPRYEQNEELRDADWTRESNPYFMSEKEMEQVLQRLECVGGLGRRTKSGLGLVPSTGLTIWQYSHEDAFLTYDTIRVGDEEPEIRIPRLTVTFKTRVSGKVEKKSVVVLVNKYEGLPKELKLPPRRQYWLRIGGTRYEVSHCEYQKAEVGRVTGIRTPFTGSSSDSKVECESEF